MIADPKHVLRQSGFGLGFWWWTVLLDKVYPIKKTNEKTSGFEFGLKYGGHIM